PEGSGLDRFTHHDLRYRLRIERHVEPAAARIEHVPIPVQDLDRHLCRAGGQRRLELSVPPGGRRPVWPEPYGDVRRGQTVDVDESGPKDRLCAEITRGNGTDQDRPKQPGRGHSAFTDTRSPTAEETT